MWAFWKQKKNCWKILVNSKDLINLVYNLTSNMEVTHVSKSSMWTFVYISSYIRRLGLKITVKLRKCVFICVQGERYRLFCHIKLALVSSRNWLCLCDNPKHWKYKPLLGSYLLWGKSSHLFFYQLQLILGLRVISPIRTPLKRYAVVPVFHWMAEWVSLIVPF